MRRVKFIPGKLKQWSCYKKNNIIIWCAGINNENINNDIVYLIEKAKVIDVRLCKKIVQFLGDHFGIIISTPSWTFAAVDYSRGYPIYWNLARGHLQLSAQANLLEKQLINHNQVTAFRMSGYTTNDNTLWQGIKCLKAGSFLFYKNKQQFYCKRYFSFLPIENNKISYKNYILKLSKQIKNIIKKIIKDAKGNTIIIPLSAGLDSRLIASGLKHFNYNKVKCFSYGLKNNHEAMASKKISKKLGYEWTFVEINHQKAKSFYKTKKYKKYLQDSADGCATSTIQGLYAINELVDKGFIKKKDILINGNSGDFISGGHIPKPVARILIDKKNLKLHIEKILQAHIEKHYSLWNTLNTKCNKDIIKKELSFQMSSELKNLKVPLFGLIELLEYENRQTKYVVNSQRIYDFYNLSWLLPLWNKSYIKFWEKVPLKYKVDQKLYKETLKILNFGGVWTDNFQFSKHVSPKWMILIRLFFKAFFFFIGKKKWRLFEKKYLNYWTENICGFSDINFLKFCVSKNIPRNYVSLYTLIAEKINLGLNWQKNFFN